MYGFSILLRYLKNKICGTFLFHLIPESNSYFTKKNYRKI